MKFLKRIQELPPKQRKTVLWMGMAMIALFLFLIYVQKIKKILRYNKTEDVKEELQIEKLRKDLQNIPEF